MWVVLQLTSSDGCEAQVSKSPKFVAKLKYPHHKVFATNFVMWVLGKALSTDNLLLTLNDTAGAGDMPLTNMLQLCRDQNR
jgi:hypothetical protein